VLFVSRLDAECISKDGAAVQTRLDTAAASGGTVQLDGRVYEICEPLIMRSNVHLRGAGRGATIIRGAAAASCAIEQGAKVCASVGGAGVSNVSVTDLTIDHRTHSRDLNGIAFVPAGQEWSGRVSTNVSVSNVEVLGAPGFHNYLIWNLKGRHVKFTGNWVDGGATADSSQEGIESFGGHDVLIANNTVQNVGGACVNVGSAGLPESETSGILIVNNYLTGCRVGVHIGTSDRDGKHFNTDTLIQGNVIANSRSKGIDVAVAPSTLERNLKISHNTIQNVAGKGAAGIRLFCYGETTDHDVVNTTVEGNLISGVTGEESRGIFVSAYPNARLIHNTITEVDREGIFAIDADHLELIGNRIRKTAGSAIMVMKRKGDVDSLVVERNFLADWSTDSAAVFLSGGRNGIIRDNSFSRSDRVRPAPVVLDASSCSISVSGNIAWHIPGWQNQSSPVCLAKVTAGDFNGDGENDILLRNYETGRNAIWTMSGPAFKEAVQLPELEDLRYHIEGTADFNGDGNNDILLRNERNGRLSLWLMRRTTLSSVVDLPRLPDRTERVVGTGDFNHDGHPDIIVTDHSGTLNRLWLMRGTSRTDEVQLPPLPSPKFRIRGTGDFNDDGNLDVVLRNGDTGQNALWLMDGIELKGVVDLPGVQNTDYTISAIGDFNGDGKPDIVWTDMKLNRNALWLMNGTSFTEIVDLPALPGARWQIVAPR
jgi:hypothetical protein